MLKVLSQRHGHKMRAMTIRAMCFFFIGLSRQGWQEYSEKPDFSDIVKEIEDVIYSQKFEGAAADMLNSNIIARELGLSDKVQNEHTGANGTALPAPVFNFNPIKPKMINFEYPAKLHESFVNLTTNNYDVIWDRKWTQWCKKLKKFGNWCN